MTIGPLALPFILAMTAAASAPDSATAAAARASGELRPGRLACYWIRPGDTAASLALRFTGNADNCYQPWFQIVNPAKSTFVPKSQYADIQSGWQVCVATERLTATAPPRYQVVASAPAVIVQPRVVPQQSAIDLRVLWWAAPLLVVVSGMVVTLIYTGKYMDERRACVALMKWFGVRFIVEFDRPLLRRCADNPAIRSRLRYAPSRRRVDIFLAPANGRTYPNLVDHRKNVEYDVERVLRVLGDEPFIRGPLRAEGPWVVIPFRFETNRQQEGAS